ncbi:unnamed protein product [Meloidogyne enterolobii]|uniref:Uncharacterized protein n=1 Tax=Meloidogyne enterolobii TaxID=390850 RepID=A0ACB0XRU0_MELEN
MSGSDFSAEFFSDEENKVFTKWIEKFKDVLSLMTEPTEAQKLLRLRFCLAGQARIAFDEMNPQPTTLAEAIDTLKRKYENGNSKVIARQILSICRQAPGESVFEFANRLSDTVRTALSGEEEETIKKRLLDEFLDRLLPDLQFEVKAQRPLEYDNAYEIALNYELLLAARKSNYNNISVASLAEKVEVSTVENNRRQRIICFNCKKRGHFARNCFFLKPDFNQRNYRPQHFGRYEDRSWHNNKNYKRNNNYFNENRPYRDENYQRNNRSNNRTRNYENYDSSSSLSSRSSSSERENNSPELGSNNYCIRSPNRRMRFERNRSPRIGSVSPFMLVVLALFCLIGSSFSAPMRCFNNTPISTWRLTNDLICPKFILEDNILKNKTPAFENECAITDVNKCRGFFDSYIQREETLNQFSIIVFSCIVTVLFVLKFVLCSILSGPINCLHIGEAIYSRLKSYRKKNKRMKRTRQIKNKIESDKSELKENKIPLSKRWPSRNKIRRGDLNKNKQNNIKICVTENTQCDINSRILTKINGITTICLLDTGAHTSIISNSNAKKIGLNDMSAANFPAVYGIGNKLVPTLGMATVELEIADCKIQTTFVIIKDTEKKNQSYSAIIGRETLSCLPLMLNFTNWELIKIPNEYKFINYRELDKISKVIDDIRINKSAKENKLCNYCKKKGHIASICFYRNPDYNPRGNRFQNKVERESGAFRIAHKDQHRLRISQLQSSRE